MLIAVAPAHALAYGGAPAPADFNAAGYNTGVYGWKSWNDLDDSPVSFHTTEPVDIGSVDGWLANVGGGIYKSKPTQLLRMFAR